MSEVPLYTTSVERYYLHHTVATYTTTGVERYCLHHTFTTYTTTSVERYCLHHNVTTYNTTRVERYFLHHTVTTYNTAGVECACPLSAPPRRNSLGAGAYRGTSLIRNCLFLGPYSRHMPRALWWS